MPLLRARVPGRSTALIAVVCISTVFLLVSCGKKEADITFSGPTATTPELSKTEFLARANVACREAERQIAARTDESGPTQNDQDSREAQASLVEAIEPIGRQAIVILRNLTPPAEDAAMVRAGIDKMASYLDRASTDPTISIDPIGLVDGPLYDYGLDNCFSAPATTPGTTTGAGSGGTAPAGSTPRT